MMEEDGVRFRSGVDENNCMNLTIGKLGKVQVVVASYSSVYYYLQENTSYKSKSGEDESSDIMVMRIGVFPKEGKLILEKGFNARNSVNFYKSSRHSHEMKAFFDKCVHGQASTITIWDRPSAKKESGYLIINYNCGIESDAELEQLSRLKDKNDRQLDYMIIENSAQPQNLGTTVKRETKQTMLFGRDIDTFMKWIGDISNFEKELKSEVKTASSFGVYIKNCGNLLENEKGKTEHSTFINQGPGPSNAGASKDEIFSQKHLICLDDAQMEGGDARKKIEKGKMEQSTFINQGGGLSNAGERTSKDEIFSQKHLIFVDDAQMEGGAARKNENDKSDGSADDSPSSDPESDSESESEGDRDINIKKVLASSRDDEYQSNADDVSNIIDITSDICDRSESQVNSSFIENSLLPDSIHNKEIKSKEITTNQQKKKSKKRSKRKCDDSSDDIHLRIANMQKKILKMENKIKKV